MLGRSGGGGEDARVEGGVEWEAGGRESGRGGGGEWEGRTGGREWEGGGGGEWEGGGGAPAGRGGVEGGMVFGIRGGFLGELEHFSVRDLLRGSDPDFVLLLIF